MKFVTEADKANQRRIQPLLESYFQTTLKGTDDDYNPVDFVAGCVVEYKNRSGYRSTDFPTVMFPASKLPVLERAIAGGKPAFFVVEWKDGKVACIEGSRIRNYPLYMITIQDMAVILEAP